MLPSRAISNHPVDVGQRCEAIVLARLVALGHDVLVPWGHNHRYDLVVDLGDGFLRVQCKSGRLRSGAIEFNAHSVRSNTKATVVRSYADDVDAFAVFCPDTEGVYVVPLADMPSLSARLRVEEPLNSQVKRIRWARDYALPEPYAQSSGPE